jgi:glycosyltransferase involved in cell wall biosynthesis
MPKVSICIPAYKPRHFEFALASAVAQSFPDVEILVSDDCPTEAIRDICASYPPRVKYSRNPSPGARNNLLRLLSLAQGEYIKYLFDDDLLHPFCVQNLLNAMEVGRAKNVRLAFSPRLTLDAENRATGLINLLNISGPDVKLIEGRQIIAALAANCTNFIGEFSTVMFRRADAIRPDGGTLIDLPNCPGFGLGDVQAWVNLASMGNVAVHPEPMSWFRMHKGSNSDPATNPHFISGVTEWQGVVDFAMAGGYLEGPQVMEAFNALLRHFNHWVATFPQLSENISRARESLSEAAA